MEIVRNVYPEPVAPDAGGPGVGRGPVPRLPHLDGIRGLAALYVVATHHLQNMGGPPTAATRLLCGWLTHGHYAVDVFIVLSGFCLMLPHVRDAGAGGRPGFGGYVARRARRILPPYFAALVLAVAVGRVVPWAASASAGGVTSHLLLVHNLHPEWVHQINPPMWSIAVEWQIYFFFPLLLLPVRRRRGVAAAVAAGFAVGLAPHFLLPPGRNLDWSFPWYLGLFATGMAAAEAAYRSGPGWDALRDRVPWGAVAASAAAAVLVSTALDLPWCRRTYVLDAVLGAAIASFLVRLSVTPGGRGAAAAVGAWARRTLARRPLLWLGAFSYSLYLTHLPVIWLLEWAARSALPTTDPGRTWELVARLTAGTAVPVVVAYAFYLVAERPLLRPARPAADERRDALGPTASTAAP